MTEEEIIEMAIKGHASTRDAIRWAIKQAQVEPVAYDKTVMNFFVQDLYDKKMQEGEHGHYETMFHVVHQAIKKALLGKQTCDMGEMCLQCPDARPRLEQVEPVAYLVLFEGGGKLLEFKKANYIHGAKVEHIPLYAQNETGCAECGANDGHALYCVVCAENFLGDLKNETDINER
jgi:hypothetical protein